MAFSNARISRATLAMRAGCRLDRYPISVSPSTRGRAGHLVGIANQQDFVAHRDLLARQRADVGGNTAYPGFHDVHDLHDVSRSRVAGASFASVAPYGA
ncbi:hypothetical protein [Burkholderia ambifaria]|uniref:hypothetical protein n=1 Tax=Burkholderia ambifaria TaxID=152480 RepID=UPI003398F10C